MYIGTNYSVVSELIWFLLGTLVHLHILYILLISRVNILKNFQVINFYVISTTAELAVQPPMLYKERGGSLPG